MRFVAGFLALSFGAFPHAASDQPGGGEAAPAVQRLPAEQINQAVERHVRARTQKGGGVYLLVDDRTGETLRLEFVELAIVSESGVWRVHDPDRLIEGPFFFACALFHPRGAPEAKRYDVDFQLAARQGGLEVTDVRVHKVPRLVNGKWIREERRSGDPAADRR